MVFRILIRCFLRTQEFFKDIAKQLVNWVETGPIKEKSTNSNFFPHYLEFHMNFFLEFQFFSSIFLEFNMKFFWNSNFFWNFICLEQTGLLISSVYYRIFWPPVLTVGGHGHGYFMAAARPRPQ